MSLYVTIDEAAGNPPAAFFLQQMTGKKSDNSFLKYGGLGLQLLATIGIAGWIGYEIDGYLHLEFPAFMLTFILASFAGMMYRLYKSLNGE